MKFSLRQSVQFCLWALTAALAAPAWAAPACVDAGGFGGTGAPIVERGVGGTGTPAAGIGGTGTPAAGIGGTGTPAAGIGGTGTPAAGIGGTGSPVAGIGGTGAPASGIGGTGAMPGSGEPAGGIGGTGIVGTITGFASICVNGLEVFYDEATPTTENGQAVDTRRLAIGQVVAIDAAPGERGLMARQVAILHAVAGPVTRAGAGSLEVMGQPVRFGPQFDAAAVRGLQVGDTVRVSGLRNARGEVVASRVDADRSLAEHSAVGTLEHGRVHGTPVAGALPDGAPEALVRGRWDGQRLVAREVIREPARPFAGRAEHLVIEARIGEVERGRLRAGGFDVRVADDTRFDRGGAQDLAVDDLVRISGRAEGRNGLRAERIERPLRGERHDGSGRRGGGGGDDPSRSDDRGADDGDRSGRGGGDADRGDRSGRSGSGRSGSDTRPERYDRVERPERVERIERPERIESERSGHQ